MRLTKVFTIVILFFISFNTYSQISKEVDKYLGDTYTTNNNPKAKGLNFIVREPLGFYRDKTNFPNVIESWVKELNEIDVLSIVIEVSYMNDEIKKLSKSELKKQVEILVNNNSVDSEFIINGYPGFLKKEEVEMERLNYEFILYNLTSTTFVNNYVLNISLICSDKKTFEENMLLFNLFANSIVFTDQYN